MMKWLALFSTLITAGCTMVESNSFDDIPADYRMEKLVSLQLNEHRLSVGVVSTGCTRVEDFTIQYHESDEACEVAVYRTRRDLCRRRPFILKVELPFSPPKHCEGKPLRWLNAIEQQGELK